jgi:transposase
LGIDDWAWKKGATYGTILVDLLSRKPIELLPDRAVETAEAWLRTHPEITLVSRDRGGDYAAAAKRGAPQAQQVADKFHGARKISVSGSRISWIGDTPVYLK